MRISDWSSDVCSSDLFISKNSHRGNMQVGGFQICAEISANCDLMEDVSMATAKKAAKKAVKKAPAKKAKKVDRKSVVQGKSVSVRVDPGGRRIIKKKNTDAYVDEKRQMNRKLN